MIRKQRTDWKTVAHPVRLRSIADSKNFFHGNPLRVSKDMVFIINIRRIQTKL
jgi:hypothetical protein